MENNMEQKIVSLNELIDAAKREDWDFVDGNINESHLSREQIDWALKIGLADTDDNVRDLAATLLDRSDEVLGEEEVGALEKQMAEDSYHIVRFRIAIALYKRGDRNDAVAEIMNEAKNDPDVGELASKYLE